MQDVGVAPDTRKTRGCLQSKLPKPRFWLRFLYQECIQRGYEHADFTLEGFEKQQDIVDETEFTW